MSDKSTFKFKCEKCNFYTNYNSALLKHNETEFHKTGKRKERTDKKSPYKCSICNYETKNIISFKQHNLNDHSTLEQRKSGFKFYCEKCDFGIFSIDLFNKHIDSEKHKNN
jgi:hypothetical protein